MSTILVMEDSQDNFDLIADALEDKHDLVHAATGHEGLMKARNMNPDLILLDMGLPVLDGWAVARSLKADQALAGIPVIAITAHAMKGDRDRCLEAGCNAYLAKPIDVRELGKLVEEHLTQTGACEP